MKRILLALIVLLFCVQTGSAYNIGLYKSTWASSVFPGLGLSSFGNDNNLSSAWYPVGLANASWGVDLGSNSSITRIRLNGACCAPTTVNIKVNGSYDNVTYAMVYSNASFTYGGTLGEGQWSPNISIYAIYRYINITIIGTAVVYEFEVSSDFPVLKYPINGSTINKSYPPLTTDINFTWEANTTETSSNLLVARDSNFNLIAVDTTTANNYSIQALEAGNYWWKVRYYNSTSGTYYAYSNVSNFTLNNIQTTAGTAINGIVYEVLNGVEVPISGALVTLANNGTTVTQTVLTGSNGYYLFTGLTNSTTYYVKASRNDIYKDSPIEYVTTGLGTWSTKNILLQRCTSDYDCGNNQHYVSFYVQTVNYAPYANVDVSITNDGEVVPIYTGTTGTDGVYQVRLIKNQKYTVTFSYGSDTVTWSNYFPSDAYTVTLGTLPLDFQYNITGSTVQFLVRWSNLNGTANMTIRNTTGKIYIQGNTSTSAGGQFSFIPVNLTDIYYLYFNASTSSGDVNTTRIYDYRGSSAHPIGRNWSYGTFSVSQEYKNYISYLFIIILSGSFGALFAPLGGVVLILTTLFFVWYGWLVVAGISTAFVSGIAVIVVVRYLQTKDGE